jgi:uncharacterized peroxidase-related enzyme
MPLRLPSIFLRKSQYHLCNVNNDKIIKAKKMARLKVLNPDEAKGKTKDLYNVIERNLGMVPNMMKTMGNSSAFLEGYLNLGTALGNGTLGAKNGELIALAVAQANACDYCLSAHTFIGANLLKIDANTLDAARGAESADSKIDAILKFARALVNKKGQVSDGDLAKAKDAGITQGEIGEIVGHVALNILTNYFNLVSNTEIDFPVVSAGATAV